MSLFARCKSRGTAQPSLLTRRGHHNKRGACCSFLVKAYAAGVRGSEHADMYTNTVRVALSFDKLSRQEKIRLIRISIVSMQTLATLGNIRVSPNNVLCCGVRFFIKFTLRENVI